MNYEIPQRAAETLKDWASNFRSERAPGVFGKDAVGLELGYGNDDAANAGRAFYMALDNGRMPDHRFHKLAYLVHATSDGAWAHLRLTMPVEAWARIAGAVEHMRGPRACGDLAPVVGAGEARDLAPPKRRRGRPVEAHRYVGTNP